MYATINAFYHFKIVLKQPPLALNIHQLRRPDKFIHFFSRQRTPYKRRCTVMGTILTASIALQCTDIAVTMMRTLITVVSGRACFMYEMAPVSMHNSHMGGPLVFRIHALEPASLWTIMENCPICMSCFIVGTSLCVRSLNSFRTHWIAHPLPLEPTLGWNVICLNHGLLP